jgi:hypothetical protein
VSPRPCLPPPASDSTGLRRLSVAVVERGSIDALAARFRERARLASDPRVACAWTLAARELRGVTGG